MVARARWAQQHYPDPPPPSSGGVTSVTGTAPITSTGGATPNIAITAATPAAAGSMSAGDKTKLNAYPPISGLTAGQVLTATGPGAVAFQAPVGGGSLIGLFSARPVSAPAGTVYYTTDPTGPSLPFIFDGTLWRPIVGGNVQYLSPAVASAWTLYQAGGRLTTFVDSAGTLLLKCTNGVNGEDIRSFYQAIPGGAVPFTFTANVVVGVPENTATMQCGLALRQSGNGSVLLFTKRTDSTGNATFARHQATASDTTQSPTYAFNGEVTTSVDWAHNTSLGFWFQIQDDGANRFFRISENGRDWIDEATFEEASGTFLTPDEFGFCIFSSNAGPTTAITRVNAMTLTTP